MKPAGKTTIRKQLAGAKDQLEKNHKYSISLEEDRRSLQSKLEKSTRKYHVLMTVCCIVLFFLILYWSDGRILTRSGAEKEISAAFSSGFSEGKDAGIDEGRELGYSDGYSETEKHYEENYSDKLSSAYNSGHKDGYEEGLIDGKNSLLKELGLMNPYTHTTIENLGDYEKYVEQYNTDIEQQENGIVNQNEPESKVGSSPTPAPTPSAKMVWVPTNGGSRYHRTSECSGMKDPQQVTLEEAESMGYGPCGRCY